MFAGFFGKMRKEEGQGLVEYALIIVLVSVALVGGLTLLTGGISNAFSAAVTAITPA
jgi:pilus assembly protein Flp/PilA